MKAHLTSYFLTYRCVYLLDSACKGCSLHFFKFVVLFSRMFLKSDLIVLFCFGSESVRLLLSSTTSELRSCIKCVRDCSVRVLFTNTRTC